MVPGEIVTVRARKQWRYAGHPYLSGDVDRHRLDVGALGLGPLRLCDEWQWDPADEYWGEEDEPIEEWARAIIARGPRPSFEMEQVLPGADPDDWDSNPILEASERNAAGDMAGAVTLLTDMLAADLRCLDAHAHLGNFEFEDRPQRAVRHYEAGLRIGELSLGKGFDGVLPWGRIDNRPFLRCMQGYGLCLWRLGRPDEATAIFERMLWLNPGDNQGVRFILPEVRSGQRWEDHHGGS
jgi:tetratricopeptide (TPR) repeat protein